MIFYCFFRTSKETSSLTSIAGVYGKLSFAKSRFTTLQFLPIASINNCIPMQYVVFPHPGGPTTICPNKTILFLTALLYSSALLCSLLFSAVLFSSVPIVTRMRLIAMLILFLSALLYSSLLCTCLLFSSVLFSAVLFSSVPVVMTAQIVFA